MRLAHAADLEITAGEMVKLSAQGTTDPDGDELTYHWWQYEEADSYDGKVEIQASDQQKASFTVPEDASKGQTIHVICEVTDDGSPSLTRYQRVVATIQ